MGVIVLEQSLLSFGLLVPWNSRLVMASTEYFRYRTYLHVMVPNRCFSLENPNTLGLLDGRPRCKCRSRCHLFLLNFGEFHPSEAGFGCQRAVVFALRYFGCVLNLDT